MGKNGVVLPDNILAKHRREIEAVEPGDQVPTWAYFFTCTFWQRGVPEDQRLKERPCHLLVERKIGRRLGIACDHVGTYRVQQGYTQVEKKRACPIRWWLDLEAPAFLRKGAPTNMTKARVLLALEVLDRPATCFEVATQSGLPVSAVRPRLDRAARQKYVAKSEKRVVLAVGSAHVYELADRGHLWLAWAEEKGILQEALNGAA